jgi:predicted hydrolase (HD superfamily)
MRWPWRRAWWPAARPKPTGWGWTGERAALVELYSTTALLHDFDYERHPTAEEHPFVGVRELERLGWPLESAHRDSGPRAVLRRAAGSHLAKALFACDELAGFLTACALVKPTRRLPMWK